MLKEFTCSPDSSDTPRRWFQDDYFDLIIWFCDPDGKEIESFQLCYDRTGNEHALTWKKSGEVLHEKVDEGEVAGGMKRSPIMLADGAIPKEKLLDDFTEASQNVEADIRDKIISVIKGI